MVFLMKMELRIPINPINGHNFRQIRINDNAGTSLLQTVGTEYSGDAGFGEVVSNEPNLRLDKLGKGKYKLESLFDPTHGNIFSNTNSEFLRVSGIGSRRNLNIKHQIHLADEVLVLFLNHI